MVILYIDIKSCDFIETSPVRCWGCFSPSEVFRSVHQQVQLPSLTHHGMDPRALHCLEVRLPTVEGWQERQDCQAMAMQNPTYFFHKPLFCEAFELNSKESRGDSYNPYPTSPHTHVFFRRPERKADVAINSQSCCSVSCSSGQSCFGAWKGKSSAVKTQSSPRHQLLKSVYCMGEQYQENKVSLLLFF